MKRLKSRSFFITAVARVSTLALAASTALGARASEQFTGSGFVTRDGQMFSNVLEIPTEEYDLVCSSGQARTEYVYLADNLYFRSATTAPAKGLRVLLSNSSDRFHMGTPFTDRAYDEGSVSEAVKFAWGSEHSAAAFVMAPNLTSYGQALNDKPETNTIHYLIYSEKDHTGIEEGNFVQPVHIQIVKKETRWGTRMQCIRLNSY